MLASQFRNLRQRKGRPTILREYDSRAMGFKSFSEKALSLATNVWRGTLTVDVSVLGKCSKAYILMSAEKDPGKS